MKQVFSALALLAVLLFNSCSSDNNDTISQSDFIAAGTDFLSATPNEETTYQIAGAMESYADGSYIGKETFEKPITSRINIPSDNHGLEMLRAGYYDEDNALFTIPRSFYYPDDEAFMGTDGNADERFVVLPKVIKVGEAWSPYENIVINDDGISSSFIKKANAKIVEYLSSYTSNSVSYKDVIRVDVAAIDSLYYDEIVYPSYLVSHYNLSFYFAKNVGLVEAKIISADKIRVGHGLDGPFSRRFVYTGRILRKQ